MNIWTVTVSVRTSGGCCVESRLEYPGQEDEYFRLKEAKDNFAELRFSAELFYIYDDLSEIAYKREYKKWINHTNYDHIYNFDGEYYVEVLL